MDIPVVIPSWKAVVTGKITSTLALGSEVYLGFSKGDLAVTSNTSVESELATPKEGAFVARDNVFTKHFNNVTKDSSAIVAIDSIFVAPSVTDSYTSPAGSEPGSRSVTPTGNMRVSIPRVKTVLAITSANHVVRIYEVVGGHINLLHSFDGGSRCWFDSEVRNNIFVVEFARRKQLTWFEVSKKSRNLLRFVEIASLALKDDVSRMQWVTLTHLVVAYRDTTELVTMNKDEGTKTLTSEVIHSPQLPSVPNSSYFRKSVAKVWMSTPSHDGTTYIIRANLLLKLKVMRAGEDILSSEIEYVTRLPTSPVDLVFAGPFAIIFGAKRLEVMCLETQTILQSSLHHMVASKFHLSFNEDLVVGAGSQFLYYRVSPLADQIQQLAKIKGYTQEGNKSIKTDLRMISLDNSIAIMRHALESGEGDLLSQLRNLYWQKALLLFVGYRRYTAAMDISSEWLLPYGYVLGLFPKQLWGDLSEASPSSVSPDTQGRRVVGSNTSQEAKIAANRKSPFYQVDDLKTLLREPTLGDDATIQSRYISSAFSPPSFGDSGTTDSGSLATQSIRVAKSIDFSNHHFDGRKDVRDLSKAISGLIVYLTQMRRMAAQLKGKETVVWKGVSVNAEDVFGMTITSSKAQTHISPAVVGELVDTSLFLCYYYSRPMMLGPFLRLPNNKASLTVVSMLKGDEMFIDEVLDFHFTRGEHRQALELLYKLSHEENTKTTKPGFSTGAFAGVDSVSCHSASSSPEFAAALTVGYLQKLNNEHLDLIFQFAFWVIDEAPTPDDSIERCRLLFMNDSIVCETYNRLKVVDFLATVVKSEDAAICYLEWLLLEDEDRSVVDRKSRQVAAKLHTQLALLYLAKLKQERPRMDQKNFEVSQYYLKLYRFLETYHDYEPYKVLKAIPQNDDSFKRFSIFIFRRLGEHQKALDVLYHELNDLGAALEYCQSLYDAISLTDENSGGVSKVLPNIVTDLLHTLLDTVISNENETVQSVEQLLNSQGDKMDSLRVLVALPPSFPLVNVAKYLSNIVRLGEQSMATTSIASNLYKLGSKKLHDSVTKETNMGYAVESSNTLCVVCGKKLGYSVLAVRHDEMVHYGCLPKRSQKASP
ncbi:hypothetical protein DICA4_E26060 [Diutina catenulata]